MTVRFFLPLILMLLTSLLVLWSIAPHLFYLQFLWILMGGLGIFVFVFLDPRVIIVSPRLLWIFYGFVASLLLISLTSPAIRETQSWIRLGVFNFQPVELAKISLVVLYAYYFSRRHLEIGTWWTIFLSLLILLLPLGLVVLQPDFGSALILGAIWFSFLLLSGLPWKRLAVLLACGLFGLILVWNFALKGYQRERIVNVFYPEQHALTFNYNVIQSKIAIGSAGWWGKGFGQGSQVQAGFLPEAQTDFIFAAFIEEWGWIPGIMLVVVFAWLLLEILRIGQQADQNVERFVCLGVVAMLLVQFFLNIGSVLGLSPVIGVPFPFFSYGGSSLVTSLTLLGIIHGISLRL